MIEFLLYGTRKRMYDGATIGYVMTAPPVGPQAKSGPPEMTLVDKARYDKAVAALKLIEARNAHGPMVSIARDTLRELGEMPKGTRSSPMPPIVISDEMPENCFGMRTESDFVVVDLTKKFPPEGT